jgi:hypothetical protein
MAFSRWYETWVHVIGWQVRPIFSRRTLRGLFMDMGELSKTRNDKLFIIPGCSPYSYSGAYGRPYTMTSHLVQYLLIGYKVYYKFSACSKLPSFVQCIMLRRLCRRCVWGMDFFSFLFWLLGEVFLFFKARPLTIIQYYNAFFVHLQMSVFSSKF